MSTSIESRSVASVRPGQRTNVTAFRNDDVSSAFAGYEGGVFAPLWLRDLLDEVVSGAPAVRRREIVETAVRACAGGVDFAWARRWIVIQRVINPRTGLCALLSGQPDGEAASSLFVDLVRALQADDFQTPADAGALRDIVASLAVCGDADVARAFSIQQDLTLQLAALSEALTDGAGSLLNEEMAEEITLALLYATSPRSERRLIRQAARESYG